MFASISSISSLSPRLAHSHRDLLGLLGLRCGCCLAKKTHKDNPAGCCLSLSLIVQFWQHFLGKLTFEEIEFEADLGAKQRTNSPTYLLVEMLKV